MLYIHILTLSTLFTSAPLDISKATTCGDRPQLTTLCNIALFLHYSDQRTSLNNNDDHINTVIY